MAYMIQKCHIKVDTEENALVKIQLKNPGQEETEGFKLQFEKGDCKSCKYHGCCGSIPTPIEQARPRVKTFKDFCEFVNLSGLYEHVDPVSFERYDSDNDPDFEEKEGD